MQAIVADTTPLNYLVLIQAADILPNLYRTVLIPPAVKAELAHANTPAIVRAWISQPPQWLDNVWQAEWVGIPGGKITLSCRQVSPSSLCVSISSTSTPG